MKYKKQFYQSRDRNTIYSASVVAEIAKKIAHPSSILDVGCGVGTWLKSFQEIDIEDIHGLEGEWLNVENLVIPKSKFSHKDISKEFDLGRKFDLAITLEVAEHIDEKDSDVFVENLIRHSDIVLFSAAIPFQGGIHHVNEQWPEYWKSKFAQRGYVMIDCIRELIWNDSDVLVWYKQNTFLYVKEDVLQNNENLSKLAKAQNEMISIVHPDLFVSKMKKTTSSSRKLFRRMKKVFKG